MAKSSSKIKITIIGGGSNAWTPNIVKDMFLTEGLSDATFVLFDINKKAADLNKKFLDKLSGELKIKPTVISTDNRAEALKGADYIIITISTGGLDAMAYDLSIPEDYKIYHTVGDTTGPGGWARFMRNFDVFASLANDINRYASGAMVLNYTNPMTTLTDVLNRICTGPVVGLCHGLFENLRFIKEYYKLENENQISAKYAGLNHFFWITEAKVANIDVIADLKKKIKKQSLTEILHDLYKDPMGFRSNREVATELFNMTGVFPYIGDRHVCECFSCYITKKKNMKEYKIKRTSIDERRKSFNTRAENLKKMIKGDIPEDYLKRSRETAADIVQAHSQGKDFIDVGNLPNTGQISNLPEGTVVETAMRVDRNGFTPINFGALPDPIEAMCAPWAKVFKMQVDACFNKDKKLAMQALRADPLCSHLTGKEVEELGERLLKAHKKFITVF
jgi:galacturan 1,4-alpha-galacturonidase